LNLKVGNQALIWKISSLDENLLRLKALPEKEFAAKSYVPFAEDLSPASSKWLVVTTRREQQACQVKLTAQDC
jgi:hypothetical protein